MNMLTDLKLKIFRELIADASNEELIWINGYLNGLMSSQEDKNSSIINHQLSTSYSIVYGTESGNSKKVAIDFSSVLKKQGLQVKMKSLDQYRLNDLSKEENLLIVMSTQGDGEPPAAAKNFFDHLHENELALSNLKYGVLALGDSSYPQFCKAGEDIDLRLNNLGAQRILSLKKCDVDFEEDAKEWIDELINTSLESVPAKSSIQIVSKKKTSKKVYTGTVVTSINLNDIGSNKETYHIEIAVDDEIVYEPGDSIGIVAKNNEVIVERILDLLGLERNEKINFKEAIFEAYDLFKYKLNIKFLPERIVQAYGRLIGKEIPAIRMDLLDLLRIYPCDKHCNVQQYISVLEPIMPRLYSISSSPLMHGSNEVHIAVSRDCFIVDENKRYGLCSDFLSDLIVNDEIEFYVHKNHAFKLPEENEDVIMIGPGTGIAPFRSFLFERDAQNASGKNWLFFGGQHFVSDFLYQTELQSLFETRTLTKFNTAFSRDQKEKIYVQHRMLQQADELFEWINNGAHIYICGTKEPMSVDVENVLAEIISSKKQIDKSAAIQYLQGLQENGKLHKDVY